MKRFAIMQKFPDTLKRLPLRWRLALASFGLFTVLLLTLGTAISITTEDMLLTNQANVLNAQARIVAMSLRGGPKETSIPDVNTASLPTLSQDFATKLLHSVQDMLGQNIGIAFVSFDKKFIALDKRQDGSIVILKPSRVQEWLTSNTPYMLIEDSQKQRELVTLQPMVIWDKTQQGYARVILQVSLPTTQIDQFVATLRFSLALGIALTLAIAAAVTLPLIRSALRPLTEIERVSSRIAEGALFLRLTESATQDEVGRLACVFNNMVARLEKAFARQKRFVADVSHELRTPLTALGGSLEMLLLEVDSGDVEVRHHLMRGMYAEIERMQRLVADLLILSRLDEGQIKYRQAPIDVGVLIGEVAEQLKQIVIGQEIRCQVAIDLPAICGDADQLRRVLLNIGENAVKFTPSSGHIDLLAHCEGEGMLAIEVIDTGIGIPQEELPHIFDRFYRVDQSRVRTAPYDGSGLGLSIAQGLIAIHNGTLTINSTPGHGTRITIFLPITPSLIRTKPESL